MTQTTTRKPATTRQAMEEARREAKEFRARAAAARNRGDHEQAESFMNRAFEADTKEWDAAFKHRDQVVGRE